MKSQPAKIRISIEHGRKVYQGSYHIERDKITVSYDLRHTVIPVGKMPAAMLAKMVLREMVGGKQENVAVAPSPRGEYE